MDYYIKKILEFLVISFIGLFLMILITIIGLLLGA